MGKKINDRQRKMQLKLRKSEEAWKKSQQVIRDREEQIKAKYAEEVFAYEEIARKNLEIYNGKYEALYKVESDDDGVVALVFEEDLDDCSHEVVFKLLKSISHAGNIYRKKLNLYDAKDDDDNILLNDKRISLEFVLDSDENIIVMGYTTNHTRDVGNLCEVIIDSFEGLVLKYLPELASKYPTLGAAMDNIESFKVQKRNENVKLEGSRSDLHS